MNVSLNAYVLFGLLEALIVLLVVGAGGIFKWRATQRTADGLRAALRQLKSELKRTVAEHKNKPADGARGYGDFLNEQLAKSSVLLGENPQLDAGQTPEDPAELARQMLAARHQFLQLELDVQAASAGHDVQAQRQAVIQGMQALLTGLSVHPDTQSGGEPGESDESAAAAASRQRSEEIKLREQVEHLRTVVGNQHDVMRELRQLVESSGDASEELQAALNKLKDAESHGIELQRSLDVVEHENERIKQAGKTGMGVRKDPASPDGDMLRDLVGNQQRTIGKLQSMLRGLSPESGRSKEFEEAIHKIQRTNNDLNSCVMVLEDENNHLRDKVDALQERLSSLEAQVDADGKSEQEATAAPAMDPETTPESGAEGAEDKPTGEATDAVETQRAPEPETADDIVGVEELDVDALLDEATNRRVTISAEVEAASVQAATEHNNSLPTTNPDEASTEEMAAAEATVPQAAPPIDGDQSGAGPVTAQPPPPAQGEAEEDDIDALLADLFANDNKAEGGSKA